MSEPSMPNTPLPFDQLAEAVKRRRSVYGYISGLRLDHASPGEAWSSLPYRPVFVGDTETGVLHGGGDPAQLDYRFGEDGQLPGLTPPAQANPHHRHIHQDPAAPRPAHKYH